MTNIKLQSKAEQKAVIAEELNAFHGIKLIHIKTQVAHCLNQIGRNGIFDEYTKHDISHIDYMLESLNWIIPEKTSEIMTPTDWLIIVLAIYFHDLGMLVTSEEFKNRDKSIFPKFKEDILNGEKGISFRDKILSIKNLEDQDRFIYQELVRATHAERIKYWILGESNPNFESANNTTKEIRELIGTLIYVFRRDLANICESHHLNDLDNFDKYKLNTPYGSRIEEVANLHYCALVLRTADLLHITSDRTPSIEYRLINPVDPISQDEWAKQNAVTAIRPKYKTDKDGKVVMSIQSDTLEVIAFFEKEDGYFGLIAYLNYARNELANNHRFNTMAVEKLPLQYEYPWKFIDDSGIEAKDFEKKQFEFTLDQTKILDLLVGHTLYNNQAVVIRELIQNSIDAIRLKSYEAYQSDAIYKPEITVDWDKDSSTLSFIDNGTGMDLKIIQNHLLKVGSSRYQDENFKKQFPNFSPISRFGIGLLTCFLIADDLDIITKVTVQKNQLFLK
jgi:molecular chaperone HtpG